MNESVKNKIAASEAARKLSPGAAVGIALSGGADSVALLAVARYMGWRPVALHCNFGLRGEESERDQRFVAGLCDTLGVPLYINRCDVAERRRSTGESIEMACRSLRYEWFDSMALKLQLDAVLLGHHREDNIETFMLNALRGAGTGGLKGMPAVRDRFMRPLLDLSKEEILGILSYAGLEHVEDSTNAGCDFARNKIRNRVLRVIEGEFPDARRRLASTISFVGADHRLLMSLVNQKRAVYVAPDGSIDIAAIFENESEPETLLFHLLDGALNKSQIGQVARSRCESGRTFPGADGVMRLLDRGKLQAVSGCQRPAAVALNLTEHSGLLRLPQYGADIEITEVSPADFHPRRDASVAWFDLDALRALPAPVVFSTARSGDRLAPFGLHGSRLVSDIFSDNKISIIDKIRYPVLRSGSTVLWVPGLRNSSLCAVTPATRTILRLRHVPYSSISHT